MKISTRLLVIGLVCVLAAASIGAALVVSARQIEQELQKGRTAADIVQGVSGLTYLTLEFARHPEERVRAQWAVQHKSLGNLLSKGLPVDSPEERRSFEAIREAYAEVTGIFPELVQTQRAKAIGDVKAEVVDELVRRLSTAVVNRTLTMMARAFYLLDLSRDEVAAAQRKASIAVMSLCALLAAIVAVSIWLAFRSIIRPLSRLQEATRVVGEGNLAHAVNLTARDEIGELAREFDKMTTRLRATTVSRDRLAASEERIRSIIESALDAVVSIDGNGVIRDWNRQAEAVFGWRRDEVLGRALAEIVIPDRYREQHRRGIERFSATGEATILNQRIELPALHREGHEFPVELSITPIKTDAGMTFSAFVRDISERRLAQSRLQAQLARLDLLNRITRAIGERQDLKSIFHVVIRNMEDNAPVDFSCICLYDSVRGELNVEAIGVRSLPLAMELAMTEHAHIPVDENGLSRCVRGELVYEPDIAALKFPFPQRLARGGLRALVIAPLMLESNVFGILVAARGQPNSFSSGECEFLRQLSEHVGLASHQAQLYGALQQAYDDLRQTQQAILQQERLRALGQMASGIAHDINNALSPVALYTESLLETEKELSARGRGYLEIIQRAVEDVARTLARMREFYRQREPQLALSPVNVNALIQEVLDLTRARWSDMPQQRGTVIRLQSQLAGDLPSVMGVESEIREALINLIFNAVDAMPEGGTLTVRSGRAEGAPTGHDGYVEVCVADTGIGMDEETRRRCLEPFFTTKGERGTGLGLAMVFGVMRRHGADIEIDSAPNQGTRVRLIFPLPAAPASPASSNDAVSASRPMARLRLLVVDDDPLLLRSLEDALRSDGHVVTTAGDGQEGIDTFRAALTTRESFDAVITDLGMPYVDGRVVAATIKAASPSIPIILLTGWGQRLVVDGDIPLHVDFVLSKPPKLRELREALAGGAARRQLE